MVVNKGDLYIKSIYYLCNNLRNNNNCNQNEICTSYPFYN